MINLLKSVLSNLHGVSVDKKYLVIESDDWGAVRTPSKDAYMYLKAKGLNMDNDPYCKFDSLESKKDVDDLLTLLFSFKNRNGCSPIFTANTIVANPNFKKIEDSDFANYYFERFTDTIIKRDGHNEVISSMEKGIEEKLWRPQFHGREHLYVKKWMNDLRDSNKLSTKEAFKVGCYGITTDVCNSVKNNYMGSLNSSHFNDISYFNSSLVEGLSIFEKIFNFKSESFIPTTYTWHPSIEKILFDNGVKFLQGLRHQRYPIDDDDDFKFKKNNYLGTFSSSGLMYLTRNVFLEPTLNPNCDWVSDSLQRISVAFKMKKPAIISSHRLNYIGSLDPSNQARGLSTLSDLLKKVLKEYPDVEFVSSDELGNIILNSVREK